ncbi:Canalicular multispecific organic anion transporter 2, partial [Entomortierella lignicola]
MDDGKEYASFQSSLKFLKCFLVAMAIAFFFEALPRKYTKVYKLARKFENPSDWQRANLFSRLSYHFFQPIVSLGATRPLTAEDLINTTPERILTTINYERVTKYWEQAKERSALKGLQPSFLWTVIRSYKPESLLALGYCLIGSGLQYVPPVLLGQLLYFFDQYSKALKNNKEPPALKIGFIISGAILFFQLVCTFVQCMGYQATTDLGIQARSATVSMIYRKSLILSSQARQSCTLGEITNHMSVDVEQWVDSTYFLVMLITIPRNRRVWRHFASSGQADFLYERYKNEHLKWMDSRLRLMTEVLASINIVKLYHWEVPFRKKLDELRVKELQATKETATMRSMLNIVFTSASLLMALCSFWVFAYIGGPNMTPGKLTPKVIFTSISLFVMVSRPFSMAAHVVSNTISISVAMERVQKFPLMEEIDETVVSRYSCRSQSSTTGTDTGEPIAINIENASFMWEKPVDSAGTNTNTVIEGERQPLLSHSAPQSIKPILPNITLSFPEGSLTAIVGRVGQGKSSLLNAIMGEMYKYTEGAVTVYGDLAYVPQQAWIINATVRDNITFGKPFNQSKYDLIINASGLKPDLEMLVAGDQTEIGERGINLSGGQKQRVSLARAAYQDADIYLLDDPLSAVDAHVDQHLWQNLIGPDGLLKDKTRLLVTHGIHHLENVDQIVVLKDGTVSEQGDYQTLMEARGVFHQLVKEYSVSRKKKDHSESEHRQIVAGGNDVRDSPDGSVKNDNHGNLKEDLGEHITVVESTNVKNTSETEDIGALVTDEKMGVSGVGWKAALTYAKAVTYLNALLCISLFVLAQACHLWTNFWLRFWISDTEERHRNGEEARPVSYYVLGYAGLVLLYIFFGAVSYTTEVVCGIHASKVLYDRLLSRILRVPLSFFGVTPMGRIINRFSSDINTIDSNIPEEMNDLFTCIAITGGTIFAIAYTMPEYLVVVPVLALAFFWIQNYYIKSSSSLKLLILESRSPLYQHFSETLAGVSTIRVTRGLIRKFILLNEYRSNIIINRYNAYYWSARWLQIRVEVLGGLAIFAATSLAVWNVGKVDSSLVGLALSYGLTAIGPPIEAPIETSARLPPNWPDQGRIVFKNYSTRHREGLDLVIKNISFTVEPTESVGIVGRTCAGKSYLTLALFRIIEAAD